MVFPKEFFEKLDFEKKQADDKKTWKTTQLAKSSVVIAETSSFDTFCLL